MHRRPHFFRDTIFLSTKSHTGNHTDCSISHKPYSYPFFRKYNSELNEQNNWELKPMYATVSQGAQYSFHDALAMLMMRWSNRKVAAIANQNTARCIPAGAVLDALDMRELLGAVGLPFHDDCGRCVCRLSCQAFSCVAYISARRPSPVD
jgi:hypothetical protein